MKSKIFILATLFSLSAFGQHENSLGERGMIAAPKVSYGTSLPVGLGQQGGYIPMKASASLASAPPPVAGSSYSPTMISTDAKPTSIAATSGGGGGGGGSKDGYMGGQGKGGAGAGAGAGGGAAGQGEGNENPKQDPEKVGQQGQQGQPAQQGPQGAPGQSGQAAQGPVNGNSGGSSGSAPQTAQVASPTPSRKPAAVPAAVESVTKEPTILNDEQFAEQLKLYRDYRANGETDRAQAVLEALSKVVQPGVQAAALDTLKENPAAIDEPNTGSDKPNESKPEKPSDTDLVT